MVVVEGESRSLSQTHSWICGTGDLAVHWTDRGLVSDQCGQWFHGQCQSVDTINYDLLGVSNIQWFCVIRCSPNSKAAFDLHGVDWTEASLLDSSNTSSIHRMLDSLRWPSLEQCRKTSRLGVMYRIYNGLVQCPIIKTKLVPLSTA